METQNIYKIHKIKKPHLIQDVMKRVYIKSKLSNLHSIKL